ncbi:hypothetical protein ACUJ8P_00875 [Pasteurella testudinis]
MSKNNKAETIPVGSRHAFRSADNFDKRRIDQLFSLFRSRAQKELLISDPDCEQIGSN